MIKQYCYLLIFTFLMFSCGKISPKGNIERKNVGVEEFVNLDIGGNFRVFYIKNAKHFIEIETYPNIIDNLNISVKNKTLSIQEKRETKEVDFYNINIYSPMNPEKISISKSAEMNISGEIKTDDFNLNIENNAVFIGAVNTETAKVEMRDKSRANFSGFTKNASIKISDTASLIAPYWKIDYLNIDSKNGNYAEVNVKNSLKGNLRNTAEFVYFGNPSQSVKIQENSKIENRKLE